MTVIRMLTHMTGGRYDNREWPGYMGEIDVPEWEAKHLINGRNAEYTDTPVLDRGYDVLKVPDPNYESKLKFADGGIIERSVEEEPEPALPSSDFDNDFERDDDDNEVEEVTPQVKRPSTVDNKAAWIDWAVANGADREKASAKTKTMLISEYGKL
jgi:hypothetical protein